MGVAAALHSLALEQLLPCGRGAPGRGCSEHRSHKGVPLRVAGAAADVRKLWFGKAGWTGLPVDVDRTFPSLGVG